MKIWEDRWEFLNDLAWFGLGAMAMFLVVLLIGIYYH